MHSLIARFMNLPVAVSALEKADQAVALTDHEKAFAEAAEAHPKSKAAVLKAKGKTQVSPEAQQHLILLAIEAATALVTNDATLGPKVAKAKEALRAEGADEEEAYQLIAQSVLEEAFGFAEDPSNFDAEFLAETLDGLVPLAGVNADVVDGWLEKFSKKVAPQQALRLTVAETLLDAAWSEGPQPISPENVDDALEALATTVASSEFAKAGEALTAFLQYLAQQKIIGPLRLERLAHLVRAALSSGLELDGTLEEEDDNDEEEDDDGEAKRDAKA